MTFVPPRSVLALRALLLTALVAATAVASAEGKKSDLTAGAPGARARQGDEPLRGPRHGRDIDVRARDMRLRESSMDRLEHIAERYRKATGARLVVTGGVRTPRRQARLMVEKLAAGEDIISLYADDASATEIRDVYVAGVVRKDKKPALERAVLQVIDAQIARGTFISRHLQARAADVRSRGMTPAQEAALRDAVAAEPGASLVDERDGDTPHFHLNL